MFPTFLLSIFLLALVASGRPVKPQLGSGPAQSAVALGAPQNIRETRQGLTLEHLVSLTQEVSFSTKRSLLQLDNAVADISDIFVGGANQRVRRRDADETWLTQHDILSSKDARRDVSEGASPSLGTSAYIIVLYSCLAAFLSVSGGICVRTYLRNRALRAHIAWEMLPRSDEMDAYSDSDGSMPKRVEDILDSTPEDADAFLLATPALLDSTHCPNPWLSSIGSSTTQKVPSVDCPDLIKLDGQASPKAASLVVHVDGIDVERGLRDALADEEEQEDVKEFFDASTDPPLPVPTPLPPTMHLPAITISQRDTAEDIINDPPLPSFDPQPVTTRILTVSRPQPPSPRPQRMREINLDPISRPAWSLRANQDPSLFVPPAAPSADIRISPFAPLELLPSALSQPPSSPSSASFALAVPAVKPRRAFRSPVPEFDIALAMQLRPGFGVGADAAWMVRFITTIFGFLSVMWTNHSNRFTPMRQQRIAA